MVLAFVLFVLLGISMLYNVGNFAGNILRGKSVKYSRTVGPRLEEVVYEDNDAANKIALGGYVLVDLKVSYSLGDRLELYARVDNATDKHYETAYLYGTYGRVGFAGVRATF